MDKLKKLKIIPDSTGLCVVLLIGLFAEAFFLALVLALDILPTSYTIGIVIALLAIDFLIVLLINSSSYIIQSDTADTAHRL